MEAKKESEVASDSEGPQHGVGPRVAAVGPYMQSSSTTSSQGPPVPALQEALVKPVYLDDTATLQMPDSSLKPPPRPDKPVCGGETLTDQKGLSGTNIPPPVSSRTSHITENTEDNQASGKGLAKVAEPPPVPSKPEPFSSSGLPTFSKPPYSTGTLPGKGCLVGGLIRDQGPLSSHSRTLPLPNKQESPPAATVRPYPHFNYRKVVLPDRRVQQSVGSEGIAVNSGSCVMGGSEFEFDTFAGNSEGRVQTSECATLRPLSPTKLLPFLSNPHRNQIPRPLKKRNSISKPEMPGPKIQKLLYQKTTLAAMETPPSLSPCSPIPDPASRCVLLPPLKDEEEEVCTGAFLDCIAKDYRPYPPSPYLTCGKVEQGDDALNLQPPEVTGQVTVPPGTKSILRKAGSERIGHSMRVKFNPLALLLDSSLEGDFNLVQRVIYDVDDPSMPNDEGITALHNAVCAGHTAIVKFLVQFGVNVNAADGNGWTPLHCAASCNNVAICKFLVESGAALFATTYSDMQTAADKCEEMEDGYTQCSQFLYGVQKMLGVVNHGVVYALWDYKPQNNDELGFIKFDCITVLRREDEVETEWWWARCGDHEGYIPRNLLGVSKITWMDPQQRIATFGTDKLISMSPLGVMQLPEMYLPCMSRVKNRPTTLGSSQFSASGMDQWTNQASWAPGGESSASYESSQAPTHFTPELLNESGAISYRFTCPGPGVFWCTLTKMVFTVDREGELLYRTVQWDESLLQSAGKKPAGPLFDIKCSEDAVSKLHLPHCEIKPAPLCLSVVHISDDGMSILEPLEITDTHVVVDVPHLSAFGLVWDIKKFFSPDPKPISGQVLLFHRPKYMSQRPKLHVFLLPENVPVQEVKGQHENAEYIVVPSSCHLIEGQTYSLQCSEAFKVQPECAPFNFKYGPNYHPTFEIRLTPSTDEATVTVRDREKRRVWEYQVELIGPDLRRENLQRTQSLPEDEERRLLSVRGEFIDRVSISVLKDLLDALLQHKVINNRELDSIQVIPSRADKAQELIDTVRKKGKQACKILIDTFCEVDPFLSKDLQLQ